MQILHCPNCNAAIPAEDINISHLIAVCAHCDTVFDFSNQDISSADIVKPKRRKMHPPAKFNVQEVDGQLELSWHWYTPVAIALTFFVVFWDGFLFVWYTIAFSTGMWLMAAFATLHLAVGVGLTYYTLALYFNRTTITVNDECVRVESTPLPIPRSNKQISAADIDQIFVKQRVSHSDGDTTISYDVIVQPHDYNNRLNLVTGLDNDQFALYIEQEIESYLGIENRPIPDEYTG